MRIAQIAPLAESVPPRLYGGTERVVSWLTEELVSLGHDGHALVVVEATDNATAVAEVLAPHVGRVVIANPKQVRVIAHAKIKTDKIDAAVLAELYASGFLPEVWIPDKDTTERFTGAAR
jgi:transposase